MDKLAEELRDEPTRHPHAAYSDGLRDLASGLEHAGTPIAYVLADCAELIDQLAALTSPTDELLAALEKIAELEQQIDNMGYEMQYGRG